MKWELERLNDGSVAFTYRRNRNTGIGCVRPENEPLPEREPLYGGVVFTEEEFQEFKDFVCRFPF